jgi:DNA-binding transcriptional regulator LsrR (DeoR family)
MTVVRIGPFQYHQQMVCKFKCTRVLISVLTFFANLKSKKVMSANRSVTTVMSLLSKRVELIYGFVYM